MTRLIGLNGLKESGKDTVFRLMKECHPELDIVRESFADRLKIFAARILGFTDPTPGIAVARMDECKAGWHLMVKNSDGYILSSKTGREYLQNVGNEARQVFGLDFWIDQALPKPTQPPLGAPTAVAEYFGDPDIVVVTDVRYENEADRIHALNGEVWEVVRPGLESDGHISEVPLPAEKVDVVLNNRGTLDELKNAVDILV